VRALLPQEGPLLLQTCGMGPDWSLSTAAIHALREPERGHLAHKNEKRQYALIIGEILALKLTDLDQTIRC
jgi:hypothetical protein